MTAAYRWEEAVFVLHSPTSNSRWHRLQYIAALLQTMSLITFAFSLLTRYCSKVRKVRNVFCFFFLFAKNTWEKNGKYASCSQALV